MTALVVDASIASSWCFPDEKTEYTNGVLRATLANIDIVVPELWRYEICNSVLIGVRRKRVSRDHATRFFASLNGLQIKFIEPPAQDILFDLASGFNLTAYDAAYLDLALRVKLPLATLDKALLEAAAKAGVVLFEP